MAEVHFVDPNDNFSLSLLGKAYRTVYKENTQPDEREPMEDWLDTLEGNNDVADMSIVILGNNLNGGSPEIMGITVGYYYKKFDAALLGYSFMGEKYSEESGMQRFMIEQAAEQLQNIAGKHGGSIDGIFVNIQNPEKVRAFDKENAENVLEAYKGWGGKVVNIDFIEPPVSEDDEASADLLLVAMPGKGGSYPSKKEVNNVLLGLYDGLKDYTKVEATKNPDYLKQVQQLNSASSLYIEGGFNNGQGMKFKPIA